MIVVYPEGVWYAKVKPGDVSEIVEEHLVAGRPVERLRFRREIG
jgi:(2Fe-2S) ferredoxin